MKTYMAKPADIERKWFVVDAAGLPLGRVATTVADILTGKTKTIYTPNVDCGDYVIVINSDQTVLTGKKLTDKKLRWHTGYIGGLKEVDYGTLMAKDSPKAIHTAVKGMLPKTSLGRKQITRLHIYKDADHKQIAQKPEKVEVKGVRN
ncbi:MAG: 50S ribosomal protein L13 [Clostridiales bacterium]|nr:50S ribosomal protein L13 [Clostridiales bacterium]